MPRKLIEVALPLDAINSASAREKSIRHGHPATLHLWWARRPLAAARAVIFAQMIDDPSEDPDQFPTESAQEAERQRLFQLIEELVHWENRNNEEILNKAKIEIWKSWRNTCIQNSDHANAKELFNADRLPAFHDPFAGGGSLPLEAQRLGLESYASDLNPVAVLINKALIEIPAKFANRPAVNPQIDAKYSAIKDWQGTEGLASDIKYYGQWLRDEAEKRIGHLYPKIEITSNIVYERPDLKPLLGRKLTLIACLWVRTVKSANAAFANIDVPLATTFMLSTKPGKEAYIEPVIENNNYHFIVKIGLPKDIANIKNGTKLARGANFRCLISGTPLTPEYIKSQGINGQMGTRLMAIIVEGDHSRIYLSPTKLMEQLAQQAVPQWVPETALPHDKRSIFTPLYGLTHFYHLFTNRQLVALTTLSDLIKSVHEKVYQDALKAGFSNDEQNLACDGKGAKAYADALAVYLGLCVSRTTNTINALAVWSQSREQSVNLFSRQSIPMAWDFPEVNPFGKAAGDFGATSASIAKTISEALTNSASVFQTDAQTQNISQGKVVSTDPPYYDNVGYADLSDFFYVWLRYSLRSIFPDLFATMAVPKSAELIATPYRHNSKEAADKFFLEGMTKAMQRLITQAHPAFPITIYYAFKQAKNENAQGVISTGWKTFLEALIAAGFMLTRTWPIRTERPTGVKKGTNVLATSIVLVCRKRPENAPISTRQEFLNILKQELTQAVKYLQQSNIAPVDLAQSAIGPGMSIYTRFSKVIDASGNSLSVRQALALINQILDEILAAAERGFDGESRWALAWFEEFGFNEAEYHIAETLSKAKNSSVATMVELGIMIAKRGKVRLLKPQELTPWYANNKTEPLIVWKIVHQLISLLENSGEMAVAQMIKLLSDKGEVARELSYRLYTICERKRWAQAALSYNSLVQSWPEIIRLANEVK